MQPKFIIGEFVQVIDTEWATSKTQVVDRIFTDGKKRYYNAYGKKCLPEAGFFYKLSHSGKVSISEKVIRPIPDSPPAIDFIKEVIQKESKSEVQKERKPEVEKLL